MKCKTQIAAVLIGMAFTFMSTNPVAAQSENHEMKN